MVPRNSGVAVFGYDTFGVRLTKRTHSPYPQYNPMIEHSGDLEVMDRDNKVTWSATMGIWPCRARDFVTHIRRATLADSSVAIINFATTHPKVRFFFGNGMLALSQLED